MTLPLTAAIVLAALVCGPLHTAALGAGLWCWRWAVMNERRAAA